MSSSPEYMRQWRAANRDKVLASRVRNKETHLMASQRWRKANPERQRAGAKAYREKNRVKLLLWAAKTRAEKAGIPFNLAPGDVLIPDVCPVLGIPILRTLSGRQRSDGSPSLDRIDNTKGYVRGNVAVISWRANRLKSDASSTELLAILAYMDRSAKCSTYHETHGEVGRNIVTPEMIL